jgi:hypothetical protein
MAADVGGDVHRADFGCASLSALNTGRSGQPMQKPGGRAGSGPSAWATSARRAALAASQARAGAVSMSLAWRSR